MEISKKQTYEQYQLQWMIDHGFSLKDLMESMDRYFMNDGDSIQELFEDWECDCGFGGILYACKDEAIDCGECIEDEEEQENNYGNFKDDKNKHGSDSDSGKGRT